jgi:hypothetical protein
MIGERHDEERPDRNALFSVNTHTPPTMTVDSGEEFTVEVRGAFNDVEDISAVPHNRAVSGGADFPIAVAVRQYRCPSLKARFLNRQNTVSTAIYGFPALFR